MVFILKKGSKSDMYLSYKCCINVPYRDFLLFCFFTVSNRNL